MIHIIKRWLYKPTYLDYFSLFTQLQVLLESGITITDAVNKTAAAQSNKVLRESFRRACKTLWNFFKYDVVEDDFVFKSKKCFTYP